MACGSGGDEAGFWAKQTGTIDVVVKGAPHPITVRYSDVRSLKFEGKHYVRKALFVTGVVFGALVLISMIAWTAGGGM